MCPQSLVASFFCEGTPFCCSSLFAFCAFAASSCCFFFNAASRRSRSLAFSSTSLLHRFNSSSFFARASSRACNSSPPPVSAPALIPCGLKAVLLASLKYQVSQNSRFLYAMIVSDCHQASCEPYVPPSATCGHNSCPDTCPENRSNTIVQLYKHWI